jgi:CRP-like cAMP-binding protein
MAKKSGVDIRKLKDEVAEHLKKSRWEKAAEVLVELAAAEPKDMTHRLRLGDVYRKMDQPQLAIDAYRQAAKFFGDEGQLIKAIGAAKIILEIDPRNPEALKQLGDMNKRRLGKVSLAKVPPPAKPPPAADRRPKVIELSDGPNAPSDPLMTTGIELPPGEEDEPLELDDGRSFKPPASRSAAADVRRQVETPEIGELELSRGEEQPPLSRGAARRRAIAPPPALADEPELDPELPPQPPQAFPDDAILTPEPEDLAAAPHDEEVIPSDEFGRQGGPIADLLSSSAEEEIELLSISADEELTGGRPTEAPSVTAEDEDFDRAFGDIAAPASASAPKVAAKKVPLFDDLPEDAFVALVNRLGYHRHLPGQLIIREGDPGRSFFIIVEGRVRVYKGGPDGKEITLAHLGEGAFFGEMALLSGAPRTANVVAEEESEILEVTDTLLRELAGRYPTVINSLRNFYRQRLLNNVMAISPLFRDFDPSERRGIVEKFRMRQAAPGEKVIVEGKSSDGLYVVLHGSVQVSAKNTEVALLKEGEIFGEMSLLTREPATATITSPGNSILLRLPRDKFQELVVTHPQILALVSELSEKRRSAIEAILQGQGEGHDGMSFV